MIIEYVDISDDAEPEPDPKPQPRANPARSSEFWSLYNRILIMAGELSKLADANATEGEELVMLFHQQAERELERQEHKARERYERISRRRHAALRHLKGEGGDES